MPISSYKSQDSSLRVKCLTLQKEENVLAQEAVLDALLRSEDRYSRWPLWDSEDQLGAVREANCKSNQRCK